ncbi:hypothetical protein FHS72_002503 [Loktanella ponticola]|uniref:Uncharacterized protein n=1 Tax=Yoonia ponticola TaxID=1524255 RepID=A0A7W9EYJ6_9RHOB|nr:hypothetical protein [Yoonia ponticola]MBB5722873.1 hypothetical protein [Yoonia ponticola]
MSFDVTEEEKLFADVRRGMIEELLRRKLGQLASWKKPTLLHSIGPTDLDVFDRIEAERDRLRALVRSKLDSMSNRDIVHVAGQRDDFEKVSAEEWQGFLLKEILQLHRNVPNALRLGLGHPDLAADIEYWGQMAHYTLHEALMLSVGNDPEVITEKSLDQMVRRGSLLPSVEFLVKRRELFRRSFRRSPVGFYSVRPDWLLDWFNSISLEVHSDFKEVLVKRSGSPMPHAKEAAAVAEAFTTQERDSLLKLVAAMACEQYSYNPLAERSPAVSNIRSDIEQIGASMDAKTIRKWLKEAATLVDPKYWADDV